MFGSIPMIFRIAIAVARGDVAGGAAGAARHFVAAAAAAAARRVLAQRSDPMQVRVRLL